MKALICETYQGIDSLEVGDFPDPTPAPGEVLIEVKAAAVNFADSLVVAGQYQLQPDTPFIPGAELTGIVEDPAGVPGLSPGDRVAAYIGFGAMAEKAVASVDGIIRLPDSVDFVEGAAIPVAYGTAYHALVDRARLGPSHTLLVLGAAGGVGLAAIQVGKALGARVIGAVSAAEKENAARTSGADDIIRYDNTNLREGIDTVTRGQGVDVVFDPVGGEMTEMAFRATKWGGLCS